MTISIEWTTRDSEWSMDCASGSGRKLTKNGQYSWSTKKEESTFKVHYIELGCLSREDYCLSPGEWSETLESWSETKISWLKTKDRWSETYISWSKTHFKWSENQAL